MMFNLTPIARRFTNGELRESRPNPAGGDVVIAADVFESRHGWQWSATVTTEREPFDCCDPDIHYKVDSSGTRYALSEADAERDVLAWIGTNVPQEK